MNPKYLGQILPILLSKKTTKSGGGGQKLLILRRHSLWTVLFGIEPKPKWWFRLHTTQLPT